MTRRPGLAAVCLALVCVTAQPARAQNVIGFDGVLSKQAETAERMENALGMGLSLTWAKGFPHGKLLGRSQTASQRHSCRQQPTAPQQPSVQHMICR